MKKCISIITALTVSLFSVSMVSSSNVFAEINEPIEILSLRSEYGKHFDNGNGTRTSYVSTVPIHYLENGEWKEINNSLVMDNVGNYTNVSSPLNISIPSKLYSGDISSIGLTTNDGSIQISLEDFITDIDNDGMEYVEATIEKNNKSTVTKELPKEMLNSFNTAVSSISYVLDNDGKELTFNIHPDSLIETISYGSNACISDNDTWLYYVRNTYNQNNGRIIALVAGTNDIHYYLRHGNGSCTNPNHDSNCSRWSHKPGYNVVTSSPFNWSPTLCDETIYRDSTRASNYYSGPWFYNIDKTTNPYNAWFYNGHSDTSTGTSFVYYD